MVTCGLVQGCFDLPHQWQQPLFKIKVPRGKTTLREAREKLVKAGGEKQDGRDRSRLKSLQDININEQYLIDLSLK